MVHDLVASRVRRRSAGGAPVVTSGNRRHGHVGLLDRCHDLLLFVLRELRAKKALVLLAREVGEVVVSMRGGGFGGVELFDFGVSCKEVLQTHVELLDGLVLLSEIDDILHELEVVFIKHTGGDSASEGRGEKFVSFKR